MTMLEPDSALARALDRGREEYNARFAQARRMRRQLQGEEFLEHLATELAPVVEALERAGADAPEIDKLLPPLYELGLDLVARGYLGPRSRYPALHTLWAQALPQLTGHLRKNPRRLVGPLTNAVFQLSSAGTVEPQRWLDGVVAAAEHCRTAGELLALGQVWAWRLGMAHWRQSALEVLEGLPEGLQPMAVGLERAPDCGMRQAIELLRADPLCSFEQLMPGGASGSSASAGEGVKERESAGAGNSAPESLRVIARLGGFVGYGGPFMSPPDVLNASGQLFVFDNRACWSVHVDCYGATLQRYGDDLPTGDRAPSAIVSSKGVVRFGGSKASFPELEGSSSFANDDRLLAVALPHSHHITVLAGPALRGAMPPGQAR